MIHFFKKEIIKFIKFNLLILINFIKLNNLNYFLIIGIYWN